MRRATFTVLLLLMTGCSATRPALQTVRQVDLNRFMGPWFVIACIPTFFETKVYNGVESYRLDTDGSIDTVFTFNEGSFHGPFKRFNPRGFVSDKINNSTWGMRFIWPFRAEYLITYLKEDYSQTIVSRNKRDYAWIMARTAQIPESDYQRLVRELASQGYDIAKLRRVPHLTGRETALP